MPVPGQKSLNFASTTN